jgi:seryl-tRNA synthetase
VSALTRLTPDDRLVALSKLGLVWRESGQAGLRGPLLDLAEKCDRAFRQIAGVWQAKEEWHPASLPADVLQRVDYLRSFPQQATFPMRLDPREANLDEFVAGPVVDAAGQVAMSALSPTHDVLTPAACYHVYAAHEGETFDSPLYVTTRNTCFRQEVTYEPLRRLRSFTMREIVCLAGRAEAGRFVEVARELVGGFAVLVDVSVAWLPATDCFFRPERNPKYVFQRLEPVKHEATYGDGLAVGSVNVHHDHFGAGFGLRFAGEPASTACVAFGVERWLFAIIDRHGFDPSSWPEPGGPAVPVGASAEPGSR